MDIISSTESAKSPVSGWLCTGFCSELKLRRKYRLYPLVSPFIMFCHCNKHLAGYIGKNGMYAGRRIFSCPTGTQQDITARFCKITTCYIGPFYYLSLLPVQYKHDNISRSDVHLLLVKSISCYLALLTSLKQCRVLQMVRLLLHNRHRT